MPWSTPFYEPIILPNGRKLVTLKDAATYITSLPKKESALPEWQTAIEVLLLCSRSSDPMMARIGVLKALHRNVVREFKTDRKETQWGKQKLKRTGREALACIVMMLAGVRDVFALSENETATKVGPMVVAEYVTVGNRSPRINPATGLGFSRDHHRVSIEGVSRAAFAFDMFTRTQH